MLKRPDHVLVLGAGPAGLTAALRLLEAGIQVTVLEKAVKEGGQSGTTTFEGRHGTYRFDYGGHRFITHNAGLLQLVEDLVGDELLTSRRKSVIRFQGRTYEYPLAMGNILKTAPTSLLAGALKDLAVLPFTKPNDDNFATWITSRFGKTLYKNFFEGYTAKLWGIDPTELSADWAGQRISLLDLKDVAKRLLPVGKDTPRTYARSYRYPKYGFGVIFERMAQKVEALGGKIIYDAPVDGFDYENGCIKSVKAGGNSYAADAVLSTLSLPYMVNLTGGECDLSFRGLRFFNMPLEMDDLSDCTWQYLSDPDIMATRLQEPKRRSPFMAPEGHTSAMLEIPCDPGSPLWEMDNEQMFAKACEVLNKLGIDSTAATDEYFSTYQSQAYPLMSVGYEAKRARAIAHLNQFNNLIQCGRQGTFRYIFTDTSMEMGQMAANALIDCENNRTTIYEHRSERTVIETESVA
ncbi:FAD-dependent oxidoreductase [Pseudovibrio brasiliensis]|uniref:FAD-dependent oxidoreductase n=1 Tax=Pseudovibrio brasiliensis TaxID=1898042 RepID=A0ABX8AG60_9HYPH|nr:FAD-dependent oxidoreductase [Pseudovibrio brasiliensis]QUS54080.1 FAD-dependent oxidoreductase [Pseudovibrio brasiliensis]